MENNQKPEWFELAENDQPVSRPRKNKKSASIRSLTFILAGVLVIPMGAGFALLTNEDQPATAVGTLNLTQDSPAATSTTQALPGNAITMPTASREDDEEDGDDDYRAPVFSNSTSTTPVSVAPVTTHAAQISPAATTSTSKAPVAITPPGSASNEIILPPTKKVGDDEDEDEDDDDHDNKKSHGKKSKDSDDEEDDD